MKIGNIEIDSRSAGLAPMAGVADMAFRELCCEFGATYVISEMVSSKGLTMCDRKSKKLLVLSEKERPAAAQIFGCDPEIMAQSAKECLAFAPDIIDINMGCPAPKIAGNGGGSALLKDPVLAEKIIRAVVNAVDIPVTVKIRTGWDFESINAVEMAQRAENAGAAAITVHGRTKAQMYAPPVDVETIAEVKRSVSIPVIANGDVTDGLSAAKMIEETNCDYILVGRGALGGRISLVDGRGRRVEPLPGGDPEHLADQVDPGDLLGDRVLDLEPGVDFQERDRAVLAEQELDGPGAGVAGLGADVTGRPVDPVPQPVVQARGRRLLDQLLVPPLQRAVPGRDHHDVAVGVGQALGLHVPGPVEGADPFAVPRLTVGRWSVDHLHRAVTAWRRSR